MTNCLILQGGKNRSNRSDANTEQLQIQESNIIY